MATLVSPGVSVSVIDESFYTSSGQGTVPLIVVATSENKLNASGTAVAEGTAPENAEKLYQLTSQRDLSQTFGKPTFHSINGTPINGYSLNEYGLLAANSYLGIANRAFVLRADVNLDQLAASDVAPTVPPEDGTYWLNESTIADGLYSWSGSEWVKTACYKTNEVYISP
jgi:hypothetical protein